MIWTEKYKPNCFDEIIGLDESIPKLVKEKMPNFLFFGPAGTGKSTTANIIGKKHDTIKINASDDRGIGAIREKVKGFASTKSLKQGKKKIIILDEADGLTPDAQEILRGVIDNYSRNCAFVLTCNFFYKIIDPLKSRCVCIEFKSPMKENIEARLKEICLKENIEYTNEGLFNVSDATYPDIRRAIKELETTFVKYGKITEETTNRLKNLYDEILELLKNQKFEDAVKIYQENQIDEDILMVQLADKIFYGKYGIAIKTKTMTIIRKAYVEMSRVRGKKLIIRPFFLELMRAFK